MHSLVISLSLVCRVERDCTEWAHEQIKSRLAKLAASSDEVSVEITKVTSVSGDVTVTQRKGKLRHNFDLNIKFSWSANVSGQEGVVEVRDFMSDTDLKGFEFYVKPLDKDSLPVELKSFVGSALRDAVWAKLQEFAGDLIDEHGKHLLVDVPSNTATTGNDAHLADEFKSAGGKPSSDTPSSTSFASWNETVEFQAPASEVFRTLTESSRVMLWSRGSLEGSIAIKGSTFKLFSGAVSGTVLDIDPAKNSLLMTWRLSAWPDGINSEASLSLEDIPSGSKMQLKQTGIPSDQFEFTSTNWTNYYWNPIKATFGYGAFPKY